MSEPNNFDRASWAQKALDAFRKAVKGDAEHALPDLLTDLMHWARLKQVDFEAALHTARMHYEAELDEENADDDGALP